MEHRFTKEYTVGKGSSRTVYDIGGGHVAKVAQGASTRFQRGLAQNRAEYTIYENAVLDDITHIAPCQSITTTDEVLVMRKLTPANDYKNMTPKMREKSLELARRHKYIDAIFWGAKAHEIPNRIEAFIYKSKKELRPKIRAFVRSKLFRDLMIIIYQYGLSLGDICRISSWGYYRGKYVLIDYGATQDVLIDYYNQKLQKGIAR